MERSKCQGWYRYEEVGGYDQIDYAILRATSENEAKLKAASLLSTKRKLRITSVERIITAHV